MYSMSYTSPDGGVYNLTGGGVEILDSTVEGLVGSVKETAYTAPTIPGQVVDAFEVQPMRGSLELLIGPSDSAQATAMALRQAFDSRRTGTLSVNTPLGVASTRVRRDGPPKDPASVNGREDYVQVKINLISDEGVWYLPPQQYQGQATVANPGDIHVWPVITWEGTQRGLVLPSGIEFPLPQVNTPHTLYLNPQDSCLVVDAQGEIDYTVWGCVAHITEGIPPKQSRRFTLKSGVKMTITPAILDPWR